jgi:putative DNA primase/helicase
MSDALAIFSPEIEAAMSKPDTKAGRLQRARLERVFAHWDEDALPTSARFIYYELTQSGVVLKKDESADGKGQRPDQPVINALSDLRKRGVISNETASVHEPADTKNGRGRPADSERPQILVAAKLQITSAFCVGGGCRQPCRRHHGTRTKNQDGANIVVFAFRCKLQPAISQASEHDVEIAGMAEYPTAKALTQKLGGVWNERSRLGKSRCPGHDDTDPSLEITEKNGRVLFICRSARCAQDVIIAGLRAKGCWPEFKANGHAALGPSRIVATYDYLDDAGVLCFQSIRYEPKNFKQRRPDGKGGWTWNLPLNARHRFLPYRLPELQEAIALNQPVLIVEGEKDVNNARRKLGVTATCNAGGAGKWRPEHAAHLKGADAVIIPDNDEAGRNHAEDVAASLHAIAARVRTLTLPNLPPKGDLSNWIEAGGTTEQLWALIEQAPDWQPQPNRAERRAQASGIRKLRSKRGSEIEMRHIRWVWPGRIAVGKHTAIAATVSKGRPWGCEAGTAPKGSIVVLSAEDGAEDTIMPRYIAAGGDPNKIHIISATEDGEGGVATFNLQADLQALEAKIKEIGDVVLVIIDPISSYLGKTDSHRNTEVRGAIEPLGEMADRLGVAILSNTHFAKGAAGGKTRALHKVIGSIAFVGAPRAAFAVVEEADAEGRVTGRRLLLHLKNNIAPAAKGLAYTLEQALAGYIGNPQEALYATRIVWDDGPVTVTADQAIAEHEAGLRGEAKERPAPERTFAEEFLRSWLKDGPQPAKQIERAAADAGITKKTLRRARERLCETSGVRNQDGKITGHQWSLKGSQMPTSDPGAPDSRYGHVDI